jgi:Cu/Ag efflux protein CusF
MQKTVVLLAGALALASLVGPAFAADTPATTAPAAEPTKAAAPKTTPERHLRGQVVSVNADAKTLTVKRSPKAKEMALRVDPAAAATLTDLKAGDRVKVTYVDEHGQLMAKAIAKNEHVAAKK